METEVLYWVVLCFLNAAIGYYFGKKHYPDPNISQKGEEIETSALQMRDESEYWRKQIDMERQT